MFVGDTLLNLITEVLQYGSLPNSFEISNVILIENLKLTIKHEEYRLTNMVPPYEKLLEECVNDQMSYYVYRI